MMLLETPCRSIFSPVDIYDFTKSAIEAYFTRNWKKDFLLLSSPDLKSLDLYFWAVVVRRENEDGEVPWWEDDGEPNMILDEALEFEDFEFENLPAVPDTPAPPAREAQRDDGPDVEEGEPSPPQSGESPTVDEDGSLDDVPEIH
ncbi:unnamed protein product [Caenorhabditis nigoni]